MTTGPEPLDEMPSQGIGHLVELCIRISIPAHFDGDALGIHLGEHSDPLGRHPFVPPTDARHRILVRWYRRWFERVPLWESAYECVKQAERLKSMHVSGSMGFVRKSESVSRLEL
jgi:hypothetical protein